VAPCGATCREEPEIEARIELRLRKRHRRARTRSSQRGPVTGSRRHWRAPRAKAFRQQPDDKEEVEQGDGKEDTPPAPIARHPKQEVAEDRRQHEGGGEARGEHSRVHLAQPVRLSLGGEVCAVRERHVEGRAPQSGKSHQHDAQVDAPRGRGCDGEGNQPQRVGGNQQRLYQPSAPAVGGGAEQRRRELREEAPEAYRGGHPEVAVFMVPPEDGPLPESRGTDKSAPEEEDAERHPGNGRLDAGSDARLEIFTFTIRGDGRGRSTPPAPRQPLHRRPPCY